MTDRPAARTFKPRRRSLSAARAAAYDASFARFGLDVEGPLLDLATSFASAGPFVLDIGFGAGEALISLAVDRPEECVIAVEVHTTGLAAVLEAASVDASSANVRVVDGDVLDFLPRLPASSLDVIRIWFPDPWPKQRQQHRRLVSSMVVAQLVDRLRTGGHLHLATDVTDYSLHMQRVCDAELRLTGGVVPRPSWRPVTRFEARGLAEGRDAVDLCYRRTG